MMKQALRRQMRRKLAGMPAEAAAIKSRAACSAFAALAEFRDASTVMLYMPIAMEVDTVELTLAAWQADKTVLMPKVTLEPRRMSAVQVRSFEDDFTVGAFGIREPAGAEAWPVDGIDLIVVPALAYDRCGNRLGKGGGFYDRFLALPSRRGVPCGLGFDEQLLDEVPTDDHDQPIDMVVTDREVLRFK